MYSNPLSIFLAEKLAEAETKSVNVSLSRDAVQNIINEFERSDACINSLALGLTRRTTPSGDEK